MKILYLITGLKTGGAEMVLRDLVNGLDKDNFDPVVVSLIPLKEIGEAMKKDGIKVLAVNAKKYNPLFFLKLLRIIKKEKPDILHTHLFHADILGRITGKLAGIPVIITTIHNINIGGKLREFLMRLTKKISSRDVAVSGVVWKNSLNKKITDSDKSFVIYNGVNLQNFAIEDKNTAREKLNMPKDKHIFLSVGSLTEQKGYDYLLEAVKSIKQDFLLFILGEGEKRAELEQKIMENRLDEKVILKGNVNNVNDYLQSADIFIMPSLWEGFSIALLEAMASGKMIITTPVGGNIEAVEDDKTGFIVEPKDSKALAEKIDYVLNLPEEEKRKITENARKSVEERFSVEKMTKEYEKLYKKLIRGGNIY